MIETLAEFKRALLSMDRPAALGLLRAAGEAGAIEAVERLVVPSLEEIAVDWVAGRVALSQVFMAGRICEALMEAVLPNAPESRKHAPPMAIAILEDQHRLGKRIVSCCLRVAGYALADFDVVTVDELIERTLAEKIEILWISTLMLPSALRIQAVTSGLKAAGARVTVVVGGAPFRLDPELWREVGADAWGPGGSECLSILSGLLEGGGERRQ